MSANLRRLKCQDLECPPPAICCGEVQCGPAVSGAQQGVSAGRQQGKEHFGLPCRRCHHQWGVAPVVWDIVRCARVDLSADAQKLTYAVAFPFNRGPMKGEKSSFARVDGGPRGRERPNQPWEVPVDRQFDQSHARSGSQPRLEWRAQGQELLYATFVTELHCHRERIARMVTIVSEQYQHRGRVPETGRRTDRRPTVVGTQGRIRTKGEQTLKRGKCGPSSSQMKRTPATQVHLVDFCAPLREVA